MATHGESSERLRGQLAELQSQEAAINEQLEEHKEVVREKNRVVDAKSKECDRLGKERNSIELQVKELEHKKANLGEQLVQSVQALERILNEHAWIDEEKALFNKPNTAYDFGKQNMREVHHRLNEIKNRKEKLSKQVDMRAMGMLAKKVLALGNIFSL